MERGSQAREEGARYLPAEVRPERYEATSLKGFVQYLSANVLPHGYWYYVTGRIPAGKDPGAVDRKLIGKYACLLSRSERARRKKAGLANVRYLRWQEFWVLIATEGEHLFRQAEPEVRDIRRVPLQVGGYSLWVKRGQYLKRAHASARPRLDGRFRSRVLIGKETFRRLLAYFEGIASRRTPDALKQELLSIPFEPYAPIRRQLLKILRRVNEVRKAAGLLALDYNAIRYHREPVKPFAEPFDKRARREAA